MANDNLLIAIENMDFKAFSNNWNTIKNKLSEQEKQFLLSEIVFYHYSDKYFSFFKKVLDTIIDTKVSLNFNTDIWAPTFLSMAIDIASRQLFDYLLLKGASINFIGDRAAFNSPDQNLTNNDFVDRYQTCLDFAENKLADALTSDYNYSIPEKADNLEWSDIENYEEINVKKQQYYYLIEQAGYLQDLIHTNRLIQHIRSLGGKSFQQLTQEKGARLLTFQGKNSLPVSTTSDFQYSTRKKYPGMSKKEISDTLVSMVFTPIDTLPHTNTQFFADINTIFREIGAILLRFSAFDKKRFSECIYWSAISKNIHTEVKMNSFLKQLLSNKSLTADKTFLKLTEGFLTYGNNTPIGANIDNIKIETLSPHLFDGELAQIVYEGGSHINKFRSAETTTKQSRRFTEQILQFRFDDFSIYKIYGAWSDWFYGLIWDNTYFLFDKANGEFWILAIADGD